jgi:hypothetical protein
VSCWRVEVVRCGGLVAHQPSRIDDHDKHSWFTQQDQWRTDCFHHVDSRYFFGILDFHVTALSHVVQANVTKKRQSLHLRKGQYPCHIVQCCYGCQYTPCAAALTRTHLPQGHATYSFPTQSALPALYDADKMLRPPSGVRAARLCPLAPQATSLAATAFLTGSDQLFDALVYWCTDTLPVPAAARNWPV